MIQHIISIILASFFATATFFPVSTLDTYFVATFTKFSPLITVGIIVLAEILSAMIVYKFGYLLVPIILKFIKGEERKQAFRDKVTLWGNKISKIGFWGIVIAGASPLPYSIVLYACGMIRWGNIKQMALAVAIGRGLKYGAFALALIFGIEFIIN